MAAVQVESSSPSMVMMNGEGGGMGGMNYEHNPQNDAAAIAAAAAQTYLAPYAATFGGGGYNGYMQNYGGAGAGGAVDIAQMQAQAIANQQMLYANNMYGPQGYPPMQDMYGGGGGMMMMGGGMGFGGLPMNASFYGGGGMPPMMFAPPLSLPNPCGDMSAYAAAAAGNDNHNPYGDNTALPLSNQSASHTNIHQQSKSSKRKKNKKWVCC